MKTLICEEPPEVFKKEWARGDLRGAAQSCARRIKSCSVNQVVGMEKRARTYGLSSKETLTAIHEGMTNVPNPDPKKVEALRNRFPK
jgi:hypothetical protein